jgi:hypothetical protein
LGRSQFKASLSKSKREPISKNKLAWWLIAIISATQEAGLEISQFKAHQAKS